VRARPLLSAGWSENQSRSSPVGKIVIVEARPLTVNALALCLICGVGDVGFRALSREISPIAPA
jgi:hypothetical protein